MDSRRLGNKALLSLANKELIKWPTDALKAVNGLIPILTTSDRKIDDPLVDFAIKNELLSFRGSIDDIALRILTACDLFDLDYVFRINGDSPFVNINLLQEAIICLELHLPDFVSNLVERTYPYGLSCELIKVSTFRTYYRKFNANQKEHVTSYYYKNLKEINFVEVSHLDNNYSHLNWTVDTKKDLIRLNQYVAKSKLKNLHFEPVKSVIEDYLNIMNIKNL